MNIEEIKDLIVFAKAQGVQAIEIADFKVAFFIDGTPGTQPMDLQEILNNKEWR